MALQKKKRGFCDFQSPHLQAFREPRISLRKSSDDHFGAKHSRGSDKACTENDFIHETSAACCRERQLVEARHAIAICRGRGGASASTFEKGASARSAEGRASASTLG